MRKDNKYVIGQQSPTHHIVVDLIKSLIFAKLRGFSSELDGGEGVERLEGTLAIGGRDREGMETDAEGRLDGEKGRDAAAFVGVEGHRRPLKL